ncbi:hypothetical protein V1514DRAFT_334340 [Lipomyces japonicus]|uniref:uncharacterized protein n=1 Tax=Lipomyces japonicus TaxID=56871 RepID=UPI0034CDD210
MASSSSTSFDKDFDHDNVMRSSLSTTTTTTTTTSSIISASSNKRLISDDDNDGDDSGGGSPKVRVFEDGVARTSGAFSDHHHHNHHHHHHHHDAANHEIVPQTNDLARSSIATVPDASILDHDDVDSVSTESWASITNHAPPAGLGDDDHSDSSDFNVVVPSRQEQILKIKTLLDQPIVPGSTWYAISSAWFDKFLNPAVDDHFAIGPIDNSDIVDASGKLLAPDVVQFEVVPESAWELLLAWHSPASVLNDDNDIDATSQQLHVIERTAVDTAPAGATHSNVIVELYPPNFRIHNLAGTESYVPQVSLSRQSTVGELVTAIKDVSDIKPQSQVRVWILEGVPLDRKLKIDLDGFKTIAIKRVLDAASSDSLADAGLAADAVLAVEEKSPFSDEWYTDRRSGFLSSTTTTTMRHRGPLPPIPRRNHHTIENGPTRTRGTTGLSNLGNTCYMNSALQCITHVEELTRYFLADAYRSELNPSNPLGMDGKVASAYAQLVHTIFGPNNVTLTSHPASSQSSSYYTPREFRSIIGRYGPMFSGYGQQDSQELLAFLLDGLHEDLNRIFNKPYSEKPELPDDKVHDKAAVVELANKCWQLHKQRNDSIIQDLFAGMYKSTLVCPQCGKVSITFDPYMDLTLPLPIYNTWSRTVTFVPANGVPVLIDVELNANASVKEYKAYIARLVNVDVNSLVSTSIYQHRIYAVHNYDNELISDKLDNDEDAFVYELDEVPQSPTTATARHDDVVVVPVVSVLRPGNKYFAYPFLVTFATKDEVNDFDVVYAKVVKKYKHMSTSKALQAWGTGVENNNDDDDSNDDDSVINNSLPEIFELKVGQNRGLREIPAQWSGLGKLVGLRERHDEAERNRQSRIAQRQQKLKDDEDVEMTEESKETLDLVDNNDVDHGNDNAVVDDDDDEGLPYLFDNPVTIPSPPWTSSDDEQSDGSNEQDANQPIPYLFIGDSLIAEWTEENGYDACFGATNDDNEDQNDGKNETDGHVDFMRGRPVFENFAKIANPEIAGSRRKSRGRHHGSRHNKLNDMDENITLEDCLNLFSKSEVLGEEDLWYCPRCQKHQQAVKTFEIWKVPDIFTVHLKRFSSTSRRDKIDAKIDFPVTGLDLSRWVGDPEQQQVSGDDDDDDNDDKEKGHGGLVYDLFAVDNHYGGLGGGHYTAHVKNFVDDKWYYFDDSSVRPVEQAQDVVTPAAYMLFYRRRTSTDVPLGGARLAQIMNAATNTNTDVVPAEVNKSQKNSDDQDDYSDNDSGHDNLENNVVEIKLINHLHGVGNEHQQQDNNNDDDDDVDNDEDDQVEDIIIDSNSES